jgi:hypothetical protein
MDSDLSRSDSGRDNAVGMWLSVSAVVVRAQLSTGPVVRAAQFSTRFEQLLGRLAL